MESRTLVSEQEYLSTAYSPDCDYVDGEVPERNLGELDHGRVQKRLILFFGNREREYGIEVVPGQRVQVRATRYRIPEVCVVLGEPDGKTFRKPPFLCVEILSPEDRMSRVRDRVEDYLKMGVPHVWVLDPESHAAYSITAAEGRREVKDGMLRTANPSFDAPLAEIFG